MSTDLVEKLAARLDKPVATMRLGQRQTLRPLWFGRSYVSDNLLSKNTRPEAEFQRIEAAIGAAAGRQKRAACRNGWISPK